MASPTNNSESKQVRAAHKARIELPPFGGDDDQGEHYYNHYDQEAFHGWYKQHEDHLPPGLAKKEHLAPGLEKAASATRNASRRIAEANSALPQRDRAYAASATA
jgi:hypothetical protein